MIFKPLEQYGHRPASEGSQCTCDSQAEHEALIARIDESFKKDSERYRTAPTSQTLRLRAQAQANGHTSIKPNI